MGRIWASVRIENPSDSDRAIRCDALVDMLGHRLVHVKAMDLK